MRTVISAVIVILACAIVIDAQQPNQTAYLAQWTNAKGQLVVGWPAPPGRIGVWAVQYLDQNSWIATKSFDNFKDADIEAKALQKTIPGRSVRVYGYLT